MAQTYDLSAPVKNYVFEQGTTIVVIFSATGPGGLFGGGFTYDGSTTYDAPQAAVNMTGYDLRLQVRRSVSDSTVLINCTLQNGKLAWIDQAAGKFKLHLQPSDTTSLKFTADSPDMIDGVYDLEIIDPTGFVGRAQKGSFVIHREVTR